MPKDSCFQGFHPIVEEWFLNNIGTPSMPQKLGWPAITARNNVLISAPTGSGKTLAAFLKCLDLIFKTKAVDEENEAVQVVYISPLKALNNDIYRNLELPIQGIRELAAQKDITLPALDVAIRTGDTSPKERKEMLKKSPDILITTPESLYIMLTTKNARRLFTKVEYLIVDEIHSVVANKRGVHLSISLERLAELSVHQITRIGLSATINPIKKVASYLGGLEKIEEKGNYFFKPRKVMIIECDHDKEIELTIEIPVKDLRSLKELTIWPEIFNRLVELIDRNKSTLIFVNNRRHAEQVANGVNKLLHKDLIKTHHGSLSKEVRRQLEEDFKSGEIRCLVATSTLELGIDIGQIELVVQVGAPYTTSQLIQRVGRSGHTLGAVSKGYIIPKTRADLLRAAFIGYEVSQYRMEYTNIPDHCLDVLAQQITSIVSEEERAAAELFALIKGAYSYRDLSYQQFESVLLMLAYPSPPDEPASLKPRLSYDRISGKISGTKLGRMLALLGAGTIPDKGEYAVYEKGSNLRVGELFEEFVFETRIGERFFLGSSVWKLEGVKKDRVIASQVHGSGGKLPFWVGDQTYWTYETGKRFAHFLGELEQNIKSPDFSTWLEQRCSLGFHAAANLTQYIKEQIKEAARLQREDRIICEYFQDEAGSYRMVVHSPFGGKVNGPLAIILHSQLTKLLDSKVEYVYNDEGILYHMIGPPNQVAKIFNLVTSYTLKEEIIKLLPSTPLFNMNLRYNLTRSLLVNTKKAGQRVPLWIQRLRSAEVAQSISKISDHPIIVETYRECLHDLFDLDGLKSLLEQIESNQIEVVDVYPTKPSSFTAELIFNFWQIYQYAEDLPIAERRNQLLLTDQSVLELALTQDGEYELIDPAAVDLIEDEMARYRYNRKINCSEDLYFFIYSFGELPAESDQYSAFSKLPAEVCAGYLEELETKKRIIRIPLRDDGALYWITTEDLPLYLKALKLEQAESINITVGFSEGERLVQLSDWLDLELFKCYYELNIVDALTTILRRYLRFQTPFTVKTVQQRYQISAFLVKQGLRKLLAQGDLVILRNSENDEEFIYCNRKVYERIKQKTVELARKDIERKEKDVYLSFLFKYQGITQQVLSGEEQLKNIIYKLQGLFLPVSWWDSFIFPARVSKYQPRMLDYLCSTGIVRWVGRMNKARHEVAFYRGDRFLTDYSVDPEKVELNQKEVKAYQALKEVSACFLFDYAKVLQLSSLETLELIEGLVWQGLITNDQFAPVRFYEENKKKKSAWKKYKGIPEMGRWSIIESSIERSKEEQLLNYLNMLIDRYGILAKEIIDLEKGHYSWSEIYNYLKAKEFTSNIKRGLFVAGFSGIQFAREDTIEELRLQERVLEEAKTKQLVAISTCDPANLYHIIKEDYLRFKIKKHPGAVVVFAAGQPVLSLKGFGKYMIVYTEDTASQIEAVKYLVEMFQQRRIWADRTKIYLEYWGEDNTLINISPLAEVLKEIGFNSEYRGMTFWRRF